MKILAPAPLPTPPFALPTPLSAIPSQKKKNKKSCIWILCHPLKGAIALSVMKYFIVQYR